MTFDPKKTRRRLKSFSIDLYRQVSFGESKEEHCLASYGLFMLDCAVECYLVGFFDIGRELALKAMAFSRAAIEYKEIPPGGDKALYKVQRATDFALSNWLVHRQHDLKNLKDAAKWQDAWFAEYPDLGKKDIQWALTEYLEAEEYEKLVKRFEDAGAKKPANLRRIQGEGALCYVIARHRLGLDYTADEIEGAIDTFLKRRVPAWLGGEGQWSAAARWMKIAFWKKGDDPIATLLRCYDYLPGVKPPKYP